MRNVDIKSRKEADVTDEALYALDKESHRTWQEHGLEASWMHRSFEEFRRIVNSTTMFVATDAETGGCWGCIASRRIASRGGVTASYSLLHLQYSVKVLPARCWPTK